MIAWILTYLATGLAFGALDAVWLTQAGPKVYRPLLDPVLADKPALAPAVVFYLVYVLGMVLLAVAPNRDAGLARAALSGAILGGLAYATYDLTNQATLKVWATRITLIDVSWGAFATAVATTAGLLAWRWASRRFG
jgi:uncharacterized membrane protein